MSSNLSLRRRTTCRTSGLMPGDIFEKCGMNPIVCEKSYKTHPLTEKQKKNHENSHSRCLIEHIFGFVERAMTGPLVRSIGMIRAKASTALTWLALLRLIVGGV